MGQYVLLKIVGSPICKVITFLDGLGTVLQLSQILLMGFSVFLANSDIFRFHFLLSGILIASRIITNSLKVLKWTPYLYKSYNLNEFYNFVFNLSFYLIFLQIVNLSIKPLYLLQFSERNVGDIVYVIKWKQGLIKWS